MRGILGVLVIGGILAAVGTLAGQRRRSTWNVMLNRGWKMMNRMDLKDLNQWARKGRRMIRNMSWT